MSGIKPAITDILAKLATINVVNQDNQTVALYSRIWNNQLQYLESGKDYEWPRPAAFVEVVSPASFEVIGLGFRSSDLGIRIHLIHDYYNQDGTYEQDLTIFDLRDQLLMMLSQYCPTACGPLNCISESQDFDHNNLYHYILEFVCDFTDSKGSPYDTAAGNFDDTTNPDMDMSTTRTAKSAPAKETDYFIIP